jgi:hypothetical protein
MGILTHVLLSPVSGEKTTAPTPWSGTGYTSMTNEAEKSLPIDQFPKVTTPTVSLCWLDQTSA